MGLHLRSLAALGGPHIEQSDPALRRLWVPREQKLTSRRVSLSKVAPAAAWGGFLGGELGRDRGESRT